MSIFAELKQQLTEKINALHCTTCWVELMAELPLASECDLLAWLKGQSHFPQSFWKNRDSDLTFATVGEAIAFEQLEDAQAFSSKTGFRLFGGLKFEGQCRLILPRLRFAKNSQKLTACLYLNGSNLAEEKAICADLLENLNKTATLKPLENTIIQQSVACDFNRWQQNIEQAISAISQQHFRKVVMANATVLECEQDISPYDLLAASQQKNLGCYHFLWAENVADAFVGSSPERLYRRQDRQFETEALAGTAAVTQDAQETERNAQWLLQDEKNIFENQLVVDDIQHHLADCVTEFTVSTAQIKRLHNVQHLRRQIYATLKADINDAECLIRIHPTAAVAGLPRLSAVNFIQQHEPFERGWYAGTLGHFCPQEAEFCVALRSATIMKNVITLYAGAGIVQGSEASLEWAEIERKALAILRLFKQ